MKIDTIKRIVFKSINEQNMFKREKRRYLYII